MSSGPEVIPNRNADDENEPFINNNAANNNNENSFLFALNADLNGDNNAFRLNLRDIEVTPENRLMAITMVLMCMIGCICSFWFFATIAQILALHVDWDSDCDVPLQKWMLVNLLMPILFGSLYLATLLIIHSIPAHRITSDQRRRYRRWTQRFFSNRTEVILYSFWILQGFQWWHKTETCHDTAPILYYVAVLSLWISTIRMMIQWILACCIKLCSPAVMEHLRQNGVMDPNAMGNQQNVETLYRHLLLNNFIQSRGTPESVINALERRVFTRDVESQRGNVQGEDCAICLTTFENGETLRVLPCQHSFHTQCIDQWLGAHRTCPMCRIDVTR